MLINELMRERGMTCYSLAKKSGIATTTISDICKGRSQIEKCNGITLYKLAKALGVSMETLVESQVEKRNSFDQYKSNVCHRLKELGDVGFIIEVLESNQIRKYHNKKWYAESLYLLAMLDYLSRINGVPLCTDFNDLRKCKLSEPVFPSSIVILSKISVNEDAKERAIRESIPEFIRFNIVESEVRNVL